MKKGFTIIEILTVIIIISIFTVISVPLIGNARKGAKQKVYETKINNSEVAAIVYAQENVLDIQNKTDSNCINYTENETDNTISCDIQISYLVANNYLVSENGDYKDPRDNSSLMDKYIKIVVDKSTSNITATLDSDITGPADITAPTISKFYLGGSDNPSYTSSINSSIYLSWNDSDVASYCISTVNRSSDCVWKNVKKGKSVTASYKLTSGDATKDAYAFIKDNAGNISDSKSSSIYLDSTSPEITSLSKNENAVDVGVTENGSGVNGVCINKSTTSTSDCSWRSVTGSTFTTNSITVTGTYYVHVRDNAGNIGHSNSIDFNVCTTLCTGTGSDFLNCNHCNLNPNIKGELYRFYGNSKDDNTPNNYICFGTTNQNTCKNDTDKYMYRILGIDSSGKMKLIKKEALNTAYKWHADSAADTKWPNSDLYGGLNGNYFLNNTTYVPSGWSSRIASVAWKYGDTSPSTTSLVYNGDDAYAIEGAWTNSVTAKIGIWYVNDFFYAYNTTGANAGSHENAKKSWIYITNNDSTPPDTHGGYEWFITRYGLCNGCYVNYYYPWYFNTDGYPTFAYGTGQGTFSVRPVFYLTSTQSVVGGSGSLTDPYYLS